MQLQESVDLAERQSKKYGVGVGKGAKYGTAWQPLLNVPEYKRLVGYVKRYCGQAISAWGLPGAGTDPVDQTLFAWFSVHGNGSSHAAHAHADARFAAVYYASVPKGSGGLVRDEYA